MNRRLWRVVAVQALTRLDFFHKYVMFGAVVKWLCSLPTWYLVPGHVRAMARSTLQAAHGSLARARSQACCAHGRDRLAGALAGHVGVPWRCLQDRALQARAFGGTGGGLTTLWCAVRCPEQEAWVQHAPDALVPARRRRRHD